MSKDEQLSDKTLAALTEVSASEHDLAAAIAGFRGAAERGIVPSMDQARSLAHDAIDARLDALLTIAVEQKRDIRGRFGGGS